MKICPKCNVNERTTQVYCNPCFNRYAWERKKARREAHQAPNPYWLPIWESDLPTDWMTDAACKGNPEPFFPTVGEHGRAAKAICKECSVLDDCREWALSVPRHVTAYGIWGGMSELDRKKERRRRLRLAAAS